MPALVKPTRLFSDTLLESFRQQGDAPADAVVTAVTAANGPAGLRLLMRWLADTADFQTAEQHPAVQNFFGQYAGLPTWADLDKMQRGMAFFKKNAQKIGLTLGLFSLPYTYLGANGAQVLWITERIKNDTARRLQETGEWVFAVHNPKEWRTGTAIARTLKIRLIHAGARWFSLHSGKWNNAWGHPVNQEDMAGTNIAFSYIVLLGLRKLDVSMTGQEEEDYLHLTGVINSLNGVVDALLPQNMREAYTLNRAIARRQFAASEAGVGLTRSLLNAIGEVAVQTERGIALPETARNLAAGEMRFFLGDEHADWLGIPKVPVEKRLAGLISRLPIFPNLV
ncbi:oxygenase MpaB family protein [Spirosoma luteum]|uniref:oxygenase MpaB family protein n=1 Tax=Spirosoma luteum TaxID=431553 RepID=UPI00036B3BAF|nr:oxygenase MpaB family protein [Spirosoma luteum]